MTRLVTDFPSRELPVTLVYAGNHRKEQNLTKQTIGRKKGALNVCFEVAEDLPGGGGSKYGSNIRIEMAMVPTRDIILAYMQKVDYSKALYIRLCLF
ncbi:Oxidoreductase, molybdopterin-binding domain-containing protein [Cynara cardunculus var. scolymus]|uniref:Oxidoreductase, molybdopterin-binding domain-containing protein n=1 Tax=Cynara cardunculus var. scolymus TaxID=59895 RepID=A0A118J6T3_CYNCS|nr:Oxidoreductase, molybdopterin-binding domain-containing protein [Cynara cardunculus var. scolymus]